MADYQGIMWGPSVKSIRDHNRARLSAVTKSLNSLKNHDGQYARDHRMLIDLYREICDVVDRHTDKARTILPPPAEDAANVAF